MMKSLLKLILIVPVLIYSCDSPDDAKISSEKDPGLYVTGIKNSLSYTFSAGNQRVATGGDDVKNLTVLLLDEYGNIAYEARYYPYYENAMPDTMYIPSLAAGKYELMAVTADFYGYYDYGYGPEGNMLDSGNVVSSLILPAYTVSEGPIYVGYDSFEVGDEPVFVNVAMKNVSAKITFNAKSASAISNGGAQIYAYGHPAKSYDLRSGEFFYSEYNDYGYAYSWLDYWTTTRSVYVMPQYLSNLNVNFYQYDNGFYLNQDYTFDNTIELQAGDAITFTLDLEQLLQGAGSGSFSFEDIAWNDLGEVSIP